MAERLQFPVTIKRFYQGKVIFQVRIEQPPDVNIFTHGNVDVTEVAAEAAASVAENGVENTNVVNSGSLRSTVSNTTVSLGQRATFYMPKGLQFQDGVLYDRVDLGRLGGSAETAIQNGSTLSSAVTRSVQDQASSITDIFNKSLSPDAARYAISKAAYRVPGDTFGDGVRSALRVATNPNTRQLFKEVMTREFAFTFRLVPSSKEEAEMSKKIIKFFRTELYPEDSVRIDVGGGQSIPIGYRFPNTFDIKFKHRDTDVIHKILPCHLVSMSTNYNATGAGFYDDGNFSQLE